MVLYSLLDKYFPGGYPFETSEIIEEFGFIFCVFCIFRRVLYQLLPK